MTSEKGQKYCQAPSCSNKIWGSGGKYCSKECSYRAKGIEKEKKPQVVATPMPLQYPRSTDGRILLRPRSLERKIAQAPLPEIPAEQVGGLDWTFTQMFGSPEEGIKMVESLVAGQGPKADPRWIQFLLACKYKRERAEELGHPVPSLNSLMALLGFEQAEFMALLVQGVRDLSVALGKIKVAKAIPEVLDSTLAASRDLEKGGKDRETLLKIGGILEDKGGLSVNVQQQVGIQIKPDDLKAPLRQFRKEIEDLDNLARDVVEGEIVEEGK